MKIQWITLIVVIAGCSTRIGPGVVDENAATLEITDCASGGKAVEIYAVTSTMNGERWENYGTGLTEPLRIRPGSYEVEAVCTKSKTGCGPNQATIIFTDYAPSYRLRAKSGRTIEADCEAGGRNVEFRQ